MYKVNRQDKTELELELKGGRVAKGDPEIFYIRVDREVVGRNCRNYLLGQLESEGGKGTRNGRQKSVGNGNGRLAPVDSKPTCRSGDCRWVYQAARWWVS